MRKDEEMKTSVSYVVDAPWEKLAAVLCHEGYNIETTKLRDGVVSAKFVVVTTSDDRMVFKTPTTEYKRTMTGAIDRRSTVETSSTSTWDRRARTLTWDHHGQGGGMIKLGGVYRLTPEDDKTRLAHDVTVEVNIPFVGTRIARMIASEFEKPDPRYKKLMDKYLKEV
jgi:hypothetical protein